MDIDVKVRENGSSSISSIEKVEVPDFYRCNSCGASGCKLWKPSITKPLMASRPQLQCIHCIGGWVFPAAHYIKNGRRYHAAIPISASEEAQGYHNAFTTPRSGWWYNLPTYTNKRPR